MTLTSPERTPTDEVMDFSAPTPEEITALHPSQEVQERVRYLLDGKRNKTLSDVERAELDSYLWIEYFVRQLKIRAQENLTNEG